MIDKIRQNKKLKMLVLKKLRRFSIRWFRTFTFGLLSVETAWSPWEIIGHSKSGTLWFRLWRDLLTTLDQQLQRPALGLEIANWLKLNTSVLLAIWHSQVRPWVKPSCAIMIIIVWFMMAAHFSCNGKAIIFRLARLKFPFHLNTQLTDEIAIALMTEFVKSQCSEPARGSVIRSTFPASNA